MGGHLGVNKTLSKITPRFYWPELTADVRTFVSSCDRCQRVNYSSLPKGNEELHPVPVPSRIWAQVGIDIMSVKEVDGYKYVITAIDYMSKYVEMRALKEKTAVEDASQIL